MGQPVGLLTVCSKCSNLVYGIQEHCAVDHQVYVVKFQWEFKCDEIKS